MAIFEYIYSKLTISNLLGTWILRGNILLANGTAAIKRKLQTGSDRGITCFNLGVRIGEIRVPYKDRSGCYKPEKGKNENENNKGRLSKQM